MYVQILQKQPNEITTAKPTTTTKFGDLGTTTSRRVKIIITFVFKNIYLYLLYFHQSRCFDPTYCYDDPPIPERANTFYEIPEKGTMRYQDGENVRYTCENSVYRFPKYDGTPKKDWIDTLGMLSYQL